MFQSLQGYTNNSPTNGPMVPYGPVTCSAAHPELRQCPRFARFAVVDQEPRGQWDVTRVMGKSMGNQITLLVLNVRNEGMIRDSYE